METDERAPSVQAIDAKREHELVAQAVAIYAGLNKLDLDVFECAGGARERTRAPKAHGLGAEQCGDLSGTARLAYTSGVVCTCAPAATGRARA